MRTFLRQIAEFFRKGKFLFWRTPCSECGSYWTRTLWVETMSTKTIAQKVMRLSCSDCKNEEHFLEAFSG